MDSVIASPDPDSCTPGGCTRAGTPGEDGRRHDATCSAPDYPACTGRTAVGGDCVDKDTKRTSSTKPDETESEETLPPSAVDTSPYGCNTTPFWREI